MRTRTALVLMILGPVVLAAAGCGAARTPSHALNARSGAGRKAIPGIAPNPPRPTVSVTLKPTLGDPCLVGIWTQTTGTVGWYGDFTLTGGAGAVIGISYNGGVSADYDNSQPYQDVIPDDNYPSGTATIDEQLSGSFTDTLSASGGELSMSNQHATFQDAATMDGYSRGTSTADVSWGTMPYTCTSTTLTETGWPVGGQTFTFTRTS